MCLARATTVLRYVLQPSVVISIVAYHDINSDNPLLLCNFHLLLCMRSSWYFSVPMACIMLAVTELL